LAVRLVGNPELKGIGYIHLREPKQKVSGPTTNSCSIRHWE